MIDMKRNNKKYMIKDKIRSRELLRLKKITKVKNTKMKTLTKNTNNETNRT